MSNIYIKSNSFELPYHSLFLFKIIVPPTIDNIHKLNNLIIFEVSSVFTFLTSSLFSAFTVDFTVS